MSDIVYKLKRKSDGLYSEGLFSNDGANFDFAEKGKCWNSIDLIKNYFNLSFLNNKNKEDCEIVMFKLVEIDIIPLVNLNE